MPTCESVAEAGGHTALEAIPGVGPSIAGAVTEMLVTGRWGFLERLKGAADPEALFCSVPGIGPSLAHKIQATLQLDSLEALEGAAHDGRLRKVPGFGARRIAMVRSALTQLLARIRPPAARIADEPEVRLAARRRSRVPGRGDKRHAAQDRAKALQSRRRGLVAYPAYGARTLALHRPLFQYGACASARAHRRLGCRVLPSGRPARRQAYYCYRDTRPGAGSPCRAWTRGRVQGLQEPVRSRHSPSSILRCRTDRSRLRAGHGSA